MKEIEDWQALIKKENEEKYEMALPLPGCFLAGRIDGIVKVIKANSIDFSNSTVVSENELYKLGKAKEEYLKMLNEYMEYSKQNNHNIEEPEL